MRNDPARIDRVSDAIERSAEEIELSHLADVDPAPAPHLQLIDCLGYAECLVKLNRARRPSCHISRQFFEQRECAAAAAGRDRVRDFATRDENFVERAALRSPHISRLTGLVHELKTEQIADIRHDPVVARLDEPVVVKLGDVVLDHVDLLGDDAQQGAQRLPAFRIALPINCRQQIVEAVGIFHFCASVKTRVSGSAGESTAICAGVRRSE